MPVPAKPKIYHIVPVDRLSSINADGGLLCDTEIARQPRPGTIIGIQEIKKRRLHSKLMSHPGLHVGDCVPFYFCPRSVMLYLIYKANHPHLSYRGGQEPIVHLGADLHKTVDWATRNGRRWAFTLSNAGAAYFEDRSDLAHLDEIDWDAVQAQRGSGDKKEGKQAEFLVEGSFPWTLVERIGVHNAGVRDAVEQVLKGASHAPPVAIERSWYY